MSKIICLQIGVQIFSFYHFRKVCRYHYLSSYRHAHCSVKLKVNEAEHGEHFVLQSTRQQQKQSYWSAFFVPFFAKRLFTLPALCFIFFKVMRRSHFCTQHRTQSSRMPALKVSTKMWSKHADRKENNSHKLHFSYLNSLQKKWWKWKLKTSI